MTSMSWPSDSDPSPPAAGGRLSPARRCRTRTPACSPAAPGQEPQRTVLRLRLSLTTSIEHLLCASLCPCRRAALRWRLQMLAWPPPAALPNQAQTGACARPRRRIRGGTLRVRGSGWAMAAAQALSASGGSSRPMSRASNSASPSCSPSRPMLTVRPPGRACSAVSTTCSGKQFVTCHTLSTCCCTVSTEALTLHPHEGK